MEKKPLLDKQSAVRESNLFNETQIYFLRRLTFVIIGTLFCVGIFSLVFTSNQDQILLIDEQVIFIFI